MLVGKQANQRNQQATPKQSLSSALVVPGLICVGFLAHGHLRHPPREVADGTGLAPSWSLNLPEPQFPGLQDEEDVVHRLWEASQ